MSARHIVTTVELDALPARAIVVDSSGDAWQKRHADVPESWAFAHEDATQLHSAGYVLEGAPLVLLSTPAAVRRLSFEPSSDRWTVEQLDALPDGAVLIDCGGNGDAWQKRTDVPYLPFVRVGQDGVYSVDGLLEFAPLKLVYVPEVSA